MNEFDFGATGENRITEVEEVPPANAVPCEFTVRFDQLGKGTYQDMGKIWVADKSLTRSVLNRGVKLLKTRFNPMLFSRRTLDFEVNREDLTVSFCFGVTTPVGPTGTVVITDPVQLARLKKGPNPDDDWDPGIIVPPGSSEEEVQETFSAVKYPNDPDEFDPEIK
jgi:hypothetical protein